MYSLAVASVQLGNKGFDLGFGWQKCIMFFTACVPSSSVPRPLMQKLALMSLPVTGSVRGTVTFYCHLVLAVNVVNGMYIVL